MVGKKAVQINIYTCLRGVFSGRTGFWAREKIQGKYEYFFWGICGTVQRLSGVGQAMTTSYTWK